MAEIRRVDPQFGKSLCGKRVMREDTDFMKQRKGEMRYKLYGEQIGPAFIDLWNHRTQHFIIVDLLKKKYEARRRLIPLYRKEAGNPDVQLEKEHLMHFRSYEQGLINSPFMTKSKILIFPKASSAGNNPAPIPLDIH